MVEFRERLNEAMRMRGVKQVDLARKIGVDRATINNYCRGKYKPKSGALYLIAKALDVNESWLMGFNVDIERIPDDQRHARIPDGCIPLPDSEVIPVRGTIACGTPITAIDDFDDVQEEVVAPKFYHADFALRCKGDSMTGARIMDGDIVLIKAQPSAEDGDIVAGNIYGEATLKILYKDRDGITLQAANPAYRPIVLKGIEAEEFRLFGIAVGFISRNMNQARRA